MRCKGFPDFFFKKQIVAEGTIHNYDMLGLGMYLERRFQQSCVIDIR